MPFSLNSANPGEVLRGVKTINFDGNTLYDKIINLKLMRKDGSSITIRSDYELVKQTDSSTGQSHYEFHTIRQKPSISVSYKQKGSSTVLKCDIRISNLFFTDGDAAIFTADTRGGNPVVAIKINMGYRSQFRAWPQQVQYSGDDALKRFYDLDDFVIRDRNDLINSGFSATVKVLDSWPEANPPDRTVYFHCIVGNAEKGLKFVEKDNFVGWFGDYFKKDDNFPLDKRDYMHKICFAYITQRFFRSDVQWREITDDDGNNAGYEVYGYKRDDDGNLSLLTEEENLSLSTKEKWCEVKLNDYGVLDVKDAEVIGVPLTLSVKVRENGKEASIIRSSSGVTSSETTIPALPPMETVTAQIQAIEQYVMAGLKPFIRIDGSIMLCHESETKEEVFENKTDPEMYEYGMATDKIRPIILPAIFDRTVNGTRTLRLPFIGFLSTGMFIGFTNRYLLGSLTGFYSPHKEDKWYKVIYSDVEFDTDGDKNMCTAVCVDADTAPGETGAPEKPEKKQLSKTAEWVEKEITLTGADGTLMLLDWEALAKVTIGNGGKTWIDPETGDFLSDVASAFPGGVYSAKAGVELLLGKNSSLSTDDDADGVGVLAGLKLPRLHIGDKVTVPVCKEGE